MIMVFVSGLIEGTTGLPGTDLLFPILLMFYCQYQFLAEVHYLNV
jgi:hypothetical protein